MRLAYLQSIDIFYEWCVYISALNRPRWWIECVYHSAEHLKSRTEKKINCYYDKQIDWYFLFQNDSKQQDFTDTGEFKSVNYIPTAWSMLEKVQTHFESELDFRNSASVGPAYITIDNNDKYFAIFSVLRIVFYMAHSCCTISIMDHTDLCFIQCCVIFEFELQFRFLSFLLFNSLTDFYKFSGHRILAFF